MDLKTDKLLALLDVGKTPIHLAVKPDGGEAFVANYDGSSVSEMITNSNEVNSTFPIGDHPVRADRNGLLDCKPIEQGQQIARVCGDAVGPGEGGRASTATHVGRR